MRPSRHSRHLSAWLTPSAFQQDPAFIDSALKLELQDTHFYTAGNHLVLHPLDLYLLKHNATLMQTYLDEQFEFWSMVSETLQSLHWKLGTYVISPPDYHLPDSTTRTLAEHIHQLLMEISHIQEEETSWVSPHLIHPPVHIFERLVKDVKHPPPFIPTLIHRFSFS